MNLFRAKLQATPDLLKYRIESETDIAPGCIDAGAVCKVSIAAQVLQSQPQFHVRTGLQDVVHIPLVQNIQKRTVSLVTNQGYGREVLVISDGASQRSYPEICTSYLLEQQKRCFL